MGTHIPRRRARTRETALSQGVRADELKRAMPTDSPLSAPLPTASAAATTSAPPSASAAFPPFPTVPGPSVRSVHDEFHGDLLEVSMGPQHPSTHGVFRMIVTLDGEVIVKLKPVFGYLHRN